MSEAGASGTEPRDPGRASARPSEDLTRHPLSLLAAGFLLTGVLGSWLTSCWANEQWENQQKYLREERALATRYEILDEVIEAIAQTTTAASDIATIGFWEWDPATREDEIAAREKAWEESSRRWRTTSRVLLHRIGAHFESEDAPRMFESIIGTRRRLGQTVRAFLEVYEEAGLDPEARRQRQRHLGEEINDLVNEIDAQTRELGGTMRGELGVGRW